MVTPASIIDPSKTPGSAGFAVVADRQVNTDITSSLMGPPVISALANGTFVAAWADGATDGAAVKFRIFASDGQPLSGEVTVAPAGANGMSSNNGFDWDNLNIVTAADGSFTLSWVGKSDGSGTSVMTSGAILPTDYYGSVTGGGAYGTANEVIVGGETAEVTGDVLDLTSVTAAVKLVATGPESGTITAARPPVFIRRRNSAMKRSSVFFVLTIC